MTIDGIVRSIQEETKYVKSLKIDRAKTEVIHSNFVFGSSISSGSTWIKRCIKKMLGPAWPYVRRIIRG